MALVESLLTAIVRADGDALVMHVGEKPYVVAPAGPIELSTQGLNLQAMTGMVAQLLPAEAQHSLSEFGAVEHELPSHPDAQHDRFSVVVARGGDDVWIEIRRQRRAAAAAAETVAAFGETAAAAGGSEVPATYGGAATAVVEVDAPNYGEVYPGTGERTAESSYSVPEVASASEFADAVRVVDQIEPLVADTVPPPVELTPEEQTPASLQSPTAAEDSTHSTHHQEPVVVNEHREITDLPDMTTVPAPAQEFNVASAPGAPGAPSAPSAPSASSASAEPLTRTLRIEVPPSPSSRQTTGRSDMDRLLGVAWTRGATALYLTTDASPHIRVD
jgi:hypothetical protein